MVLRAPIVQLHILIERDLHLGQTRRADARSVVQRRQHEQVERHDRGRGISGQREDRFGRSVAGVVLERHGREGRRLARLHRHAAEVDRAAQRALDRRLEQVELTHRHAAAGDDDVGFAQGGTQG